MSPTRAIAVRIGTLRGSPAALVEVVGSLLLSLVSHIFRSISADVASQVPSRIGFVRNLAIKLWSGFSPSEATASLLASMVRWGIHLNGVPSNFCVCTCVVLRK